MAIAEWSDDEDRWSPAVSLNFFPVTPLIQGNDLFRLIPDFFDWLETAWQLPVFQPDVARLPLPPPLTLTEEQYTIPDLARLCGCTFDWLYRYVERFQIVSPGYVPYLSPTGTKGQCRAFRKEDLALFLEQWEWKRLTQVLDQWWLRFYPPACSTCQSCRRSGRSPMAQQFFCSGCVPLNNLRVVFTHFLQELGDDPERARDWHYLFDRTSREGITVKKRGCLSPLRVSNALAEALLIAARTNPDGLFQSETYHRCCHYRRRKGQRCLYFAATDGVTTCPCCGSPLSGKLGARCNHVLTEDFVCNGEALSAEMFCPKCEMPLAAFLPITTHVFRHNSVSRAHRAGVSLAHNMRLHGHKTVPMHLRYLHLLLEDTTDEVRQIFVEKRLRDVRQVLGSAPGQIVEGGIAYTVSLEQYLGLTLQRTLKRRTYGIWGGFWAGALAQRGVASPFTVEDEIVIPEDTYEHTVAQYWYESLGLAVSEIAFEHVTEGKWRAEVPPFLDRRKIEALVRFHLGHVQDSFKSALGQRLMETDILEQRRFLNDLAEKLRPWWKHLGTIDQLVEMFAPGGGHAFQKQLPSTEPAS